MTLPGRRSQGGWAQRNEGSSWRELVKKLRLDSRVRRLCPVLTEFDCVPCTSGHQNFAAERNLSATESMMTCCREWDWKDRAEMDADRTGGHSWVMLTLVTRAGSLRFINGWFVQQSPLHFSCVVARGERGERWPEAWPRPASKTHTTLWAGQTVKRKNSSNRLRQGGQTSFGLNETWRN